MTTRKQSTKKPRPRYVGPLVVHEVVVERGSRKKILDRLWGIEGSGAQLEEGHRMIAFLSMFRANQLLRAYTIDRNPDHIFEAWCEFDSMELLPPETMFRNLRRAIDERKKKPAGKTKSTTLRDVAFLRAIVRDGSIPTQVDSKIIKSLAKSHRMTEPAVRRAITRLRKMAANFAYEAPRAFRDK